MNGFSTGHPVEFCIVPNGGPPDAVLLERLEKEGERVPVQERLFEERDGRYYLSLPTQGLAPGRYDIEVRATSGTHLVAIEDSFVLNG